MWFLVTDDDDKVVFDIIFAARFDWLKDDPEIISDVLFAVANVISIARTTYLMPAFEVLGPLQISLGRMMGDITRFLVLFTLVNTSSVLSTVLYVCVVHILPSYRCRCVA